MFFSRKAKFIILCLVLLIALFFLTVGSQSAGEGPVPSDNTKKLVQDIQEKHFDADDSSQPPSPEVKDIQGNTYIYYDEFQPGKPITYTFYDDGSMVAYYWEDTEAESIPLSSVWSTYSFNADCTEITLNWDDGSVTTEPFTLTDTSLTIGTAKFKLSDREIHFN